VGHDPFSCRGIKPRLIGLPYDYDDGDWKRNLERYTEVMNTAIGKHIMQSAIIALRKIMPLAVIPVLYFTSSLQHSQYGVRNSILLLRRILVFSPLPGVFI
jgi:hypothetical protein